MTKFAHTLLLQTKAVAKKETPYGLKKSVTKKMMTVIPFSLIPPTMSSGLSGKQKVFDNLESQEIKERCAHIIKAGAISAERVMGSLPPPDYGNTILEKYTIQQVQTRLKYERRNRRLKKKR